MNKTPHCLICLGVREVVLQHGRVKQDDFCCENCNFWDDQVYTTSCVETSRYQKARAATKFELCFFSKALLLKSVKIPVKLMSWSMTTSGVCFYIFRHQYRQTPHLTIAQFFWGRCPSSRIFFLSVRKKLTRIMRCMRFACGLLPKKLRGRKRAKKGGHLEKLKMMGWFKKPYIPVLT